MNNTKSLKWNASANFAGLGYTTIIGIVVLPLYLEYLGAEAFGLVGFFFVLQAWMQLFDMGMSPLLSRQTAQSRGRNIGYLELRRLLRSLELVFLIVAVIVVVGMATGNTWITNNWLNVTSLAPAQVADCILLMGAIIGLRFFSSLYRSGIQGMENQVGLNIANSILVTFRFIGALLLLMFVTQDITEFFLYQFAIGVFELLVLGIMFYRLVPSAEKIGVGFFWNTIKPVLPFAGGIAYTAIIWVVLTQLDKLILSNVLPLSTYGYFALVAVIATGISQIGAPISQAVLPRMTYLLSQGNEDDMLVLYRQSTQLMAVLMLPLTGIVALFSTELLFAWTGDRKAAEWAGPVLFWFALGNGVLAISAFQFYLQFAHGKLRMHVIYNSITAIVQIPVIIYVAYTYGAMGVAVTWFVLRLLSFIIWTPIVHNKFARGIHWPWLFKDVGPSFLMTMALLLFMVYFDFPFDDMKRSSIFATLIGAGLLLLLCNILVSSAARTLIYSSVSKYLANEK
ncbi:MAG: oligosaccharide flippase family protein [Woeseiaceae bacterium]